MGNISKYKRLFFIFQCDDMIFKGFSKPSGYLRIIQNGYQSKALLDLTNFDFDDNADHEMIFIFSDKNRPADFPMFTSFKIKTKTDRVLEEFSFDTYNICESGLSLKELWGVVIYTKIAGENSTREYFPLKSIKNEDRPWRDILLNKLKQQRKTKITEKQIEIPVESDDDAVGKNSREFVKKAVDEIFKQTIEPQPKQSHKNLEVKHEEQEEVPDSQLENLLEIIESKIDSNRKNDNDSLFNQHFENYDPFGTTNHQYRWWRCHDMHKVNEVLLSINIGVPFELNKDGYIACEAHGHVVVGLYSDRKTSRDFVVIGIPAENRESIGNYHNNSRWEDSEEGYTPAGYWLTYIDMKTSNVVRAAN